MLGPGHDHIFIWLGPTFPTPPSLPTHAWELFHVGKQRDNPWSLKPLSSFGMWRNSMTIYLGTMTMMSTSMFVILTRYCHIGTQRGRIPTQKTMQCKRCGRGWGQAEWRCDVTRGCFKHVDSKPLGLTSYAYKHQQKFNNQTFHYFLSDLWWCHLQYIMDENNNRVR